MDRLRFSALADGKPRGPASGQSFEFLDEALKRILAPHSSMAFLFGSFAVMTESRELRRADARIPLTPRAFELLALLIRERPRAFDKDELLTTLWPDTFVSEGSLAQLVTEVRQALGDSAREPKYIRTLHRYGYAFVGEAREDAPVEQSRSKLSPFLIRWHGQEIPLARGENVIGRDPDARIRLHTTLASRRHARIDVTERQAVLTDLGSRNGTYLGDRRITDGERLADGDQIVIGDDVIVFCGSNGSTTTRTGSILKKP